MHVAILINEMCVFLQFLLTKYGRQTRSEFLDPSSKIVVTVDFLKQVTAMAASRGTSFCSAIWEMVSMVYCSTATWTHSLQHSTLFPTLVNTLHLPNVPPCDLQQTATKIRPLDESQHLHPLVEQYR